MHSFHRSRGKIFFEVVCAFGISASFVGAWMQTYAPAFLPAAAIAALFGLVHAFDMVGRRSATDRVVAEVETVTGQGDLLDYAAAEPVPVIAEPEFAEPSAEVVAETATKRKRKSTRDIRKPEPDVAEAQPEPQLQPVVVETAEVAEPEVAEPKPAMHVVETVPDEPEYIPATPLFEPEPFVRQQRAAFGRKAR